MFLYEKFKEAEAIVLARVSMADYYYGHVDSTADLHLVHLNCPIHDDSTASFRYFEDTDTFYCYGCMHGGNVIVLHRFILKREIGEPDEGAECKISYSYALRDLAKLYNIQIPSFYSADLTDEIPIQIDTIKNIEVPSGLTLKAVTVELERDLTKLKSRNKQSYIQFSTMIDTFEVMPLSKDEKIQLYTQTLKGIKAKLH